VKQKTFGVKTAAAAGFAAAAKNYVFGNLLLHLHSFAGIA
jgi:hypothetical protein